MTVAAFIEDEAEEGSDEEEDDPMEEEKGDRFNGKVVGMNSSRK